ncbi:hypothetical protein KEM55_003425 [Ascosphaera atra]|nr:hypothetical protein KEM55_003425 [Ascosphaera atra]
MQGNPTGMLLYALACRHGWGMRPNAKEGMKWLRKAVANVGTELNNPKKREEQAPQSIKEREAKKAKQAQFALAVYELGIREWGDVDALAEAGFCYAEGVGCRKNLKKAAKLYRMAEAKGMSMVGNSWIHKEKYLDEEEKAALAAQREAAGETPASKKARDKSHTRSFFGRKRSH